MDARSLIRELGSTLGLSLELSSDNTCQVVFDTDAVDFEVVANKGRGEALFLIAELGLRSNEPAVLSRLLEANYLGGATGNATIGLNAESFMLHRQLVISSDASYAAFEQDVVDFVTTLRYWKEWLTVPQEAASEHESIAITQGMISI